jgi:hypothetical protein
MSGIGKQFKGSGIAKVGFQSKHEQARDHLKSGGLSSIGNLRIPRNVRGRLDMLADGGKVRKHYEDGSDQEGVQPDRSEAQQKAYDEIHSQAEKDRADIVSNRQQREDQNKERKQKTEDDIYEGRLKHYENQKTYFSRNPSSPGPTVNKFFSKYVDDPLTYVANKVIPGDNSYDKANRKARKDVLGYKKGGSANWIKGAIKHPGALRASLHVKAGEKIPAKKLAAAAKKPGVMGKRARLAQTLKGFKK